LSKTSSRDIKKKLFEFAKNEYVTKSPEYVEVRKAKGTKTFYHGPIPKLILTRYKAIAYTVFVDYGSLARLYYFNRQGYCIRDTSYSEDALIKIKQHLMKTSTKIIRYPKLEQKPTISNLSVKLDNRFSEMINDLEKITKVKLTNRPLITLSTQRTFNEEFLFQNFIEQGNFIEAPKGIEEKAEVEILLSYTACKLFIKQLSNHEKLSEDLAFIGALLLVTDTELRTIILDQGNKTHWKIDSFTSNLRMGHQVITTIFNFAKKFKEYLIGSNLIDQLIFNDRQKMIELVDFVYFDLFSKVTASAILAKFLLEYVKINLKNKDQVDTSNHLLLIAFLEIESSKHAEISKQTMQFANSNAKSNTKGAFTAGFLHELNTLRISAAIKNWRRNRELFSTFADEKFDEITDKLFLRSLKYKISFGTTSFDKAGDIVLEIENLSDAPLTNFISDEFHWTPRDSIDIIGETRKIKLRVLEPGKQFTLRLPILPKKKGSVNFNSLRIKFNDPFGFKHYINLPIPTLKIS